MATSSFFRFSVLFVYFSVTLSSPSHPHNFTFELIHRDSPRSPLYNPVDTVTDRLNAAYHRSISRSHRLNKKTHNLKSGMIEAGGEFLMSISIGTPPRDVYAIADTGSDLIWVQCEPCTDCYKQKGPFFDTKKSSTYKNVPCNSPHCQALSSSQRDCNGPNEVCGYIYKYGGKVHRSFTKGYLATETISINSASSRSHVSFPGTVFGCGHNNRGSFDETGSGIVGLGGGELSLISQLSSTISKKFSYCLSPKSVNTPKPLTTTAKSVINLGANSFPSGSNVISTPFVIKDRRPHYYLTLEAISVGKTKIPYTGKTNNPNDDEIFVEKSGNIIIDSGTTYTLLDPGFFDRFIKVVKDKVKGADVNGPHKDLPNCFKARSGPIGLPDITMHFTGADVKLNRNNAFVEVSKGLFCLTMIPNLPTTKFAVYGFYSQLDFLVGYHLEKKTVLFQRKDCSASK